MLLYRGTWSKRYNFHPLKGYAVGVGGCMTVDLSVDTLMTSRSLTYQILQTQPLQFTTEGTYSMHIREIDRPRRQGFLLKTPFYET